MKTNKMAAVRELLKSNPDATAKDIVSALTKQKIKISEGVASNYKSVIRASEKKAKKATKAPASAAPALQVSPKQAPSRNGHGLDPELVELLKLGRTMGWDKVRAIADLVDG